MTVPNNVITSDMLKGGKKGQGVAGLILCRSYSVSLTKSGKEYIQGTMQSGIEIPFKAWGNAEAFVKLKNEEYAGQVCLIQGTFDDYGGTFSLIIQDINAVDMTDLSLFLPERYNADIYWNGLVNLVKANVSEKGFAIANETLFANEEVANAFKIEFAASGHHDNCKSGLLAHTYKVVYYVTNVIQMYPNLAETADVKDILWLGALFHDIGKTKEMKLGVYQPCSKVTHRYLGIEMVNKAHFVETYGEDRWLDLVSIFLQHHGEYEDKCKTALAYIVHKADCFDADMTFLAQAKENPIQRSGVNSVRLDSTYLALP